MPKYEYACKTCGEHIEVKQSFKDDPLTECPTCGGVLRKVFSSPGIVLRGPGFYRTDHRSPYRPDGMRPPGAEKDKEASETKDDSSKGDAPKAADSKPAASTSESAAGSASPGSGGGGSGGPKDAARTA